MERGGLRRMLHLDRGKYVLQREHAAGSLGGILADVPEFPQPPRTFKPNIYLPSVLPLACKIQSDKVETVAGLDESRRHASRGRRLPRETPNLARPNE
ncbi:hypothetical protein O3P69_020591 [Scylla paramamosain]|uniref:Uncharacterized protein n=1 Tax=Scylla paramamosain TaxID=85552 RepID=A0AAW0TPU1_SCYPA